MQLIPKNCYNLASIFLNEVWDKRRVFGFYDAIFGNFSEESIFFNMTPNKTIAQKGGKTISIFHNVIPCLSIECFWVCKIFVQVKKDSIENKH